MPPPTPSAGIGLRQPHYRDFRETRPKVGFVEVHSENFFNPHDAAAQVLSAVREDYPVSLHGVGLALGSACGLDPGHLERLAALVERVEPVRVSDHAACARAPWRRRGVVHANDLLPVAFTRGSLEVFCANVQRVQERLRRPILVENLSAYLSFAEADFAEPEFLAELARRTGCRLLLDVNNLMVNALNAGAADPPAAVCRWLDALAHAAPRDLVGEIHLAGHSRQHGLVIDDHSEAVAPPTWKAFEHALGLFGPVPTLIEWDERLPALDVLLGEAGHAQTLLERAAGREPALEPGERSSPARGTGAAGKREAARQRALVEAIFAPEAPLMDSLAVAEAGERLETGLAAYRGNGLAHAIPALRVQFPTVRAMLGAEAFEAVCVRYWRGWPPRRGDLAWAGEEFPECLDRQPDLRPWPWLSDCARLDWALWRVLFEAPSPFGTADLERLADGDPGALSLRLAPGAQRLASPWPVVTLWQLHRSPDPEPETLRAALESPGETAWVWREGWESRCRVLAAPEAQWLTALSEAPDLAAALEAVPPAFDFGAWLAEAVRHGWLGAVAQAGAAVDARHRGAS